MIETNEPNNEPNNELNNDTRAQETYERGLRLSKGSAEDLIRAEACFGDAAEAGHAAAEYELAMMQLGVSRRALIDGDGNTVVGTEADADPVDAIEGLRRAAQAGYEPAQAELARREADAANRPRTGRDGVVYSPDGTVVLRGSRGVREIRLEPTVKRIVRDAFAGCLELERIEFPEGLEEIGDRAFDTCVRLAEAVLPAGVTKIGAGAFRKCVSLGTVSLPEGLLIVPEGAFEGCVNLGGVRLPQSVVFVGVRAFADCTLLEKLELPRSVERIEGDAFLGCLVLRSVRVCPEKPLFKDQLEAISFHDVVRKGRESEELLTRIHPDEMPRAIRRRAQTEVERPL